MDIAIIKIQNILTQQEFLLLPIYSHEYFILTLSLTPGKLLICFHFYNFGISMLYEWNYIIYNLWHPLMTKGGAPHYCSVGVGVLAPHVTCTCISLAEKDWNAPSLLPLWPLLTPWQEDRVICLDTTGSGESPDSPLGLFWSSTTGPEDSVVLPYSWYLRIEIQTHYVVSSDTTRKALFLSGGEESAESLFNLLFQLCSGGIEAPHCSLTKMQVWVLHFAFPGFIFDRLLKEAFL